MTGDADPADSAFRRFGTLGQVDVDRVLVQSTAAVSSAAIAAVSLWRFGATGVVYGNIRGRFAGN